MLISVSQPPSRKVRSIGAHPSPSHSFRHVLHIRHPEYALNGSLASPSHAHNLEITILIPDPALPQQLPLLVSVAVKPDQKSQAGVA